jgi:hypothetical protein
MLPSRERLRCSCTPKSAVLSSKSTSTAERCSPRSLRSIQAPYWLKDEYLQEKKFRQLKLPSCRQPKLPKQLKLPSCRQLKLPKSLNIQKKSSQIQQSQRTLLPSATPQMASEKMGASPSASNWTQIPKLISGTSPSQQLLTRSQDHRLRLYTSTDQASFPPTSPLLLEDLRTRETMPSPLSKLREMARILTQTSSLRSRASRTPS